MGALARFNKFPTYTSCKALLRVLIYLRDRSERGIQFTGSDFILSGYSDADWGGDLESRRSTTGYVVIAAGGPIAGGPIETKINSCSIHNGSRIHGCIRRYTRADSDQRCWVN